MPNIIKTRETLAQIRHACIQIAFGCERLATAEVALGDLCELVDALRATYGTAGNVLLEWQSIEIGECEEDAASCDCLWHENLARAEASHIDPELDHDGDTQPSNERPEPSEK